MKNFKSTQEGKWFEIVKVDLTDAEKHLLMLSLLKSELDSDKEAKAQVIKKIRDNSEVEAQKVDADICKSLYDSNKPELKDTDKFFLIGVNCYINNEECHGIINCRVNDEHVQVRF